MNTTRPKFPRQWLAANIYTIFLFCLSYSETIITGDISSINFLSSGNPFIIEANIEAPAGKKVIIGKGCVLLFKEFTGLNVRGSLVVAGTNEEPVIFTSIHDTAYGARYTKKFSGKSGQPPNPFDWNGIFVDKNADSVYLDNFKLTWSVYGLKSQTERISIINGLFQGNGQFDFTVNDRIQYAQRDIPVTYHGMPGTSQQQSKAKPAKRVIGRWLMWSSPVFLIAGGCFIYFAQQNFNEASKREEYLNNAIIGNDAQYASMQREYIDRKNGGIAKRNAGFTLLGIGAVALGVGIVLVF
jgi:hypothetical protein